MRAAFFSYTQVSAVTRPHDLPDLYLAPVALTVDAPRGLRVLALTGPASRGRA